MLNYPALWGHLQHTQIIWFWNREERRPRIWSNYLNINRPRWNERTSDAGSSRTRQWTTSRGWDESVECERSRRGRGYFQSFSLYRVSLFFFPLFVWCYLQMEDKKSVSRGKGGVAERANNPNLISIYCNRREDNQHFVVCFIQQGPSSVYFNRDRNDFLNALLFKMLLKWWKHLDRCCCQIFMRITAMVWIMQRFADMLEAFIYILYWQRGSSVHAGAFPRRHGDFPSKWCLLTCLITHTHTRQQVNRLVGTK